MTYAINYLKEGAAPTGDFTLTIEEAMLKGMSPASDIVAKVVRDLARRNVAYKFEKIGLQLADDGVVYDAFGKPLYRMIEGGGLDFKARSIEFIFKVFKYEEEKKENGEVTD